MEGSNYDDGLFGLGVPELIVLIAACLLVLPPLWRIFRRTGLGGAWSLCLLIPILGPLVVTLVLAFAQWPAAVRPQSDKEIR